MRRGRRWWLTRIAIPLVAALGLFVWALLQSRNVVRLENRSGRVITSLQIIRGGETTTFNDVPAGSTISATTKTGGSFTVEGRLADGTLIRGRFGELETSPELIVLPGGQLTFRKGKE